MEYRYGWELQRTREAGALRYGLTGRRLTQTASPPPVGSLLQVRSSDVGDDGIVRVELRAADGRSWSLAMDDRRDR